MVEEQSAGDVNEGPQTFAAVFAELESDLLYFAMKYVKSYEVSEDVVQDAFLSPSACSAPVVRCVTMGPAPAAQQSPPDLTGALLAWG